MVTANVEDLGDEFDQIISDRDFTSVGVIGLAGAGGGVITTQIINRFAPTIGLSANPSSPRDLFGVGFVKMLIGAFMGYVGIQVGGTAGTLLALGGLGTVVLGGGDWVNVALTAGGSSGSAPARRSTARGGSGNRAARVVRSTSRSGGSSSGGSTAAQRSGDTTSNLDMYGV